MDADLGSRLLALARWTLQRFCAGEPWLEGGPALPPEYDRPVDGLFVTLRQGEALRGCIGTVERQDSLDTTLRRMAVQAAAQDPRFAPVNAEELPGLTLTLSLLSPPEVLDDPGDVVIGRDGLIIEQGGRRGLLLPEVPVELGWDRERFLDELCGKAFLPPGAWRDPDSSLYRFGSEQISEAGAG